MNNWQVQGFRVLDAHRTVKTSELAHQKTFFAFKIPTHDFHKENNWFRLNSIHCNHRHRRYNYRRRTITKTEELTELYNSPSENIPFFQNANSRFLVNTIIRSILTLFTSCKHRHQYYMASFKFSSNCDVLNFFKAYVTYRCCAH